MSNKPINTADDSNITNKPFQTINWPKSNVNTQLQQVKAAGISGKPNTANPVAPAGVSPTTQGQPKNLSNIRVTKTDVGNGQYQLTISFDRDPTDPYYGSTKIYAQQGGSTTPVVVGEGTASPIKVLVNKTSVPTTIFAQATGNWGSVPLTNAPVQTLSLSNISPTPTTSTGSGGSSGGGSSGGGGSWPFGGNYAANQVLASPAGGGSGPLSVRAMVAADITIPLTVAAGTNLSGGGSVALGGSVTLNLANIISLTSAGVLKFNGDTGISRDSAGVLAVGNGTQDDLSGIIIAGRINLIQPANSGDIYKAKRNTDTTPTGNFLHLISAASADLFVVDVTGTLVTGSMDAARVTTGVFTAGQYITMVGDSGSGGTKGAVPAPAAGDAAAGKFLKADGTWATPAGGGSGTVNSGTANHIAYYATSTNAVSSDPLLIDDGVTLGYGGNNIEVQTLGVYRWGAAAGSPPVTADTGLSRGGAGIVYVGNGTQGDRSGTVDAAVFSAGNGTNAAPSFGFQSSTNTGMYLLSAVGSPPAAGIGFTVTGALALTVDDFGLIVVGNILPSASLGGDIGSSTLPWAHVYTGVLNLAGVTSGVSTITPPAIAGTNSNPIVFSNAISVPNGNVSTGGNVVPSSAAAANIGTAPLPWANLFVGSAANNSAKITGTFTANRTVTLADANMNFSTAASAGPFTGANITALTTLNGVVTTYTGTSDARLKENIQDFTAGLNEIIKIHPSTYSWNEKGREKTGYGTEKHIGFIAQDLQQAIPEAVYNEGEWLAINREPILAALVNAVKELKAEIEELKTLIRVERV